MAGRRGKRRQEYMSNDLTVYDFADSSKPAACARLKKGVANSTINEVKKLSGVREPVSRMKEEDEEISWFDKDLDDFDIPVKTNSDGEEAEEINEVARPCRRRNRRTHRNSENEKSGIVYPVDLWYQLSKYIHPESLHKFASLCRHANETTQRYQFWRNMYTRFYSKHKELPEDLQPQAMERNHGLRARCVRALYILEPSLAERVQPRGPYECDPHKLVGYRCLLAWHQPSQGKWHFCFKLQKPSLRRQSCNSRPAYLEDMRHGYNNLFYNPEDGCCVLQVTSTHFASTSPHVMGQLLSAVHLTLSHGFRHQRLRLSFDSCRHWPPQPSSSTAGHAVECILDPAIAIRVFHWWDPNYPFPT